MGEDQKTTSINATLRKAREARGISLADAAAHVGVTQASFSRMETGKAGVSVDRLVMLASYYGYSPAALLDDHLIKAPSTLDMTRVHAIVSLVQEVIKSKNIKPSPEKVADAVTEVYQHEIDRLMTTDNPTDEFDADVHREFIIKFFKR